MSDSNHILHICITCRAKGHDDAQPRAGKLFYDAISAKFLDSDIADNATIMPVKCLVQCDNICAASLSHQDKFNYLLSGLNPDTHQDDLLNFFEKYCHSADGIVPFAERPKSIKSAIKGRIAPAQYDAEQY